MRAVFLDQLTFNPAVSLSHLEAQVNKLTCYQITLPENIISRCIAAEIIITNKVVLNANTLRQLPNLKLICIAATGTNNIDIIAAKDFGIAVTNVSGYAKQSVAQYVFAQILEYYNRTSHHNHNTEQGLWQQSNTFCYHGEQITEIADKTLGIIGYGSLGKSVANIARAFGMKVLIAERPNVANIRSERLPFDEVVKQADILTLHCPLTPNTEALINSQVLSSMKTSAMLINTARGAIIDNNALINALKNKQIAYAVLDVLDIEPPPSSHPLLNCHLDNLKVTAHIAWASIESQQRLINGIAENIITYRDKQRLNQLD